MPFNFIAILVAALATLVVGFVWYHPKVFGTIWMKETGMTEEQIAKGNMAKIYGLTLLFSLLFAFMIPVLCVHQVGVFQAMGADESKALPSYAAFMADYGNNFRSIKHGILHGIESGLFLAFPLIAINGLFEHKSWRYILITSGYWITVMTVMCAIVCAWK